MIISSVWGRTDYVSRFQFQHFGPFAPAIECIRYTSVIIYKEYPSVFSIKFQIFHSWYFGRAFFGHFPRFCDNLDALIIFLIAQNENVAEVGRLHVLDIFDAVVNRFNPLLARILYCHNPKCILMKIININWRTFWFLDWSFGQVARQVEALSESFEFQNFLEFLPLRGNLRNNFATESTRPG